jgi:hypothetical protein
MEPSTRIIEQPQRAKSGGCCSSLRWKGMFIDAEPDTSIPNTSDGFFWCSVTMTCLGPDSRVADEESCCHGRKCFEPW